MKVFQSCNFFQLSIVASGNGYLLPLQSYQCFVHRFRKKDICRLLRDMVPYQSIIGTTRSFSKSVIKIKHLQFIDSGTLLACLVTSISFKSTNVYNIVTPRQRIQFEYIMELVNKNYSVFIRLLDFHYLLRKGLKIMENLFSIKKDSVLIITQHGSAGGKTELCLELPTFAGVLGFKTSLLIKAKIILPLFSSVCLDEVLLPSICLGRHRVTQNYKNVVL